MARLLHGACLNGCPLPARDVTLGLIAALFHDTGYIQSEDDLEGTGAKYTLVHVARSVEFMEKYFRQAGLSSRDLDYCRCCVQCTGLDVRIEALWFESPHHREVGWTLGTADLLGQMADQTCWPDCRFFIGNLPSARPGLRLRAGLFKKDPGFLGFYAVSLNSELGNARCMLDHFRAWWGLNRDLSRESIEENITYLKFILENHELDYLLICAQEMYENYLPQWNIPKVGECRPALPA
jgi:hypothetical protein